MEKYFKTPKAIYAIILNWVAHIECEKGRIKWIQFKIIFADILKCIAISSKSKKGERLIFKCVNYVFIFLNGEFSPEKVNYTVLSN